MRGKTGAARMALEHDIPVIPVAHWGTQQVMARYAKKISFFPRKTIAVKIGDPVDLSAFRGRNLDAATLTEATDGDHGQRSPRSLEDLRGEKAPATALESRRARPEGDRAALKASDAETPVARPPAHRRARRGQLGDHVREDPRRRRLRRRAVGAPSRTRARDQRGRSATATTCAGINLPRNLRATVPARARRMRGAEQVFVSIPSQTLRVEPRGDRSRTSGPTTVVVSLMKGVEKGTGLRMSEVIAQGLPDRARSASPSPPGRTSRSRSPREQPTAAVGRPRRASRRRRPWRWPRRTATSAASSTPTSSARSSAACSRT